MAIVYGVLRALEHLRGINEDECRRLRSRGIRNTNQLLHSTTLDIDRETLARRTGIPAPRLLEFAHQCALLEVSGLEAYLPVLRRLGITSQKALKQESAPDLYRRLVEAVGFGAAPAPSQVEYWISQVRSIDVIEETDAAAEQPVQFTSPSLLTTPTAEREGPDQP
ncbi:MAG TPA: DUF4332 domain-containing protein [Candidatus Dormibacteraeota bacterium]